MLDILKQETVEDLFNDLQTIKQKVSSIENTLNPKPTGTTYGEVIDLNNLEKTKVNYNAMPLTKGCTAILEKGLPVVREISINTTEKSICVTSGNKIYNLPFGDLIRLAKDNNLFN